MVVRATYKPHVIDMTGLGRRLRLKLYGDLPNACACEGNLESVLGMVRHLVHENGNGRAGEGVS